MLLYTYYVYAKKFIQDFFNFEKNNPTEFSKFLQIAEITYELIEPKLEEDNSVLLIKTDFSY